LKHSVGHRTVCGVLSNVFYTQPTATASHLVATNIVHLLLVRSCLCISTP